MRIVNIIYEIINEKWLKSLSHITGGGIIENLPRALPSELCARVHLDSWEIPILFNVLQDLMNVDKREMFRVFNMGIGMIVIANDKEAKIIQSILPEVFVMGEIEKRIKDEQVRFV